jgi:hypothetical protein
MLGGGYLSVQDSYKPRDVSPAKCQIFTQSGIGFTIPLSDYVHIVGGARAMLTSDTGAYITQNKSGMQTSWMYNLSIKLALYKKAKRPKRRLFKR